MSADLALDSLLVMVLTELTEWRACRLHFPGTSHHSIWSDWSHYMVMTFQNNNMLTCSYQQGIQQPSSPTRIQRCRCLHGLPGGGTLARARSLSRPLKVRSFRRVVLRYSDYKRKIHRAVSVSHFSPSIDPSSGRDSDRTVELDQFDLIFLWPLRSIHRE
jgi:hypothetical protein